MQEAEQTQFRRYIWVAYAAIAALLALNAYFVSENDYVFFLLPLVLIVGYLVFYRPSWSITVIGFLTPLSIRYEVHALDSTFNFPTEPLIALIMLLFFFKIALDWRYDENILKHPLTIAILLSMGWIFITSLFSTMPVVSWKYFLSRMWFVVVFYFLAVEIFKHRERILHFIWGFAASLSYVVIRTLNDFRSYGYDQEFAPRVVQPFMNDHTEYGAVLGLFIPVIAGFALKGKNLGLKNWHRIIALGILVIMVTGVIYSYSRASWVGLAGAVALLTFLLLRIRFWIMMLIVIVSVTFIYQNQYEIAYSLTKNQEVSGTDFEQHVHSIYNITTDASNTERINRWVSALRMYEEKPVFGFGPGTYMFQYAPYQLASNMTIISTRTGDGGNAHSEYLGPLSEQGLPGLIFVLMIKLIALYKGIDLYFNGKTAFLRTMALLVTLSLSTYFIHGFLNNFLDFDKASVPYWAYMAVITSLDLANKGKNREVMGD